MDSLSPRRQIRARGWAEAEASGGARRRQRAPELEGGEPARGRSRGAELGQPAVARSSATRPPRWRGAPSPAAARSSATRGGAELARPWRRVAGRRRTEEEARRGGRGRRRRWPAAPELELPFLGGDGVGRRRRRAQRRRIDSSAGVESSFPSPPPLPQLRRHLRGGRRGRGPAPAGGERREAAPVGEEVRGRPPSAPATAVELPLLRRRGRVGPSDRRRGWSATGGPRPPASFCVSCWRR